MRFLIINYFLFISNVLFGQPPAIQWQYTFGGNLEEKINSICLTPDGGIALLGYVSSGLYTNNYHGYGDVWLLKLDSGGDYQWNQCLGGIGTERSYSIKCTLDSGFIIAAKAGQNDGDVSGVHGAFPGGGDDFWVIKTNKQGSIQWKKCYGGSEDETPYDIIQTSDGGYFAVGESYSNDFDVSGNNLNGGIWALKLNADSSIQWAKAFGGSSGEVGLSCIETDNSNLFFAGYTFSNDGNINNFHGGISADSWVVKLNPTGQIIWQKCYGGTGEESPGMIVNSSNGGFYLLSTTSSHDGDVTSSFSGYDYWLLKADSNGTILWQKCFGGNSQEMAYALAKTIDGGLVMAGVAYADNGQVTGTQGFGDFWVVKTDSIGNFEWGKAIGGTQEDYPTSIAQTNDGGYIVSGYTKSNDGDVTGNHGDYDGWVVKLSPPGLQVPELENTLQDLKVSQSNDQLNIRFFSKHHQKIKMSVYNIEGKIIFSENTSVNEGINYQQISCSTFAGDIYCFRVDGNGFTQSIKFMAGW